jgi:hypothetical protein
MRLVLRVCVCIDPLVSNDFVNNGRLHGPSGSHVM